MGCSPFLNLIWSPNGDVSGTTKSESLQQELTFTQCFEESDGAQLQGDPQNITRRDETGTLQMAQQKDLIEFKGVEL